MNLFHVALMDLMQSSPTSSMTSLIDSTSSPRRVADSTSASEHILLHTVTRRIHLHSSGSHG